jgi:hypothetical protein
VLCGEGKREKEGIVLPYSFAEMAPRNGANIFNWKDYESHGLGVLLGPWQV